jgi:hypothetical protein
MTHVRVWPVNPQLAKRLGWIIGVTTPIYLMLTVLMPPGFFGVPWMGLVLLVFLGLFSSLLIFEKSALWNGVIAIIFWMPILGLMIAEPGIHATDRAEVFREMKPILLTAEIHVILQYSLRHLLNKFSESSLDEDADLPEE